tara:strand:- start:298 stop:1221 length:924 start_codon:yes stop_codon:yes gene_type:complete
MNLIEKFREELFRDFYSNKESIYLGEDVRNAHRGIAIGLHEKFGDKKVIDMPISESAFTGLGLGLAIKGKKVFVEFNFAGLVYLGLDQIFNQAHKYNEMLNTKIPLDIVYLLPTGTRGGLAGHHSDNPYALLSHLGIRSFMPTNSFDCDAIFKIIREDPKPTALFLPVAAFFNEIEEESKLKVNNSGFYKLHDGKLFNIICTGTTYNLITEVLSEQNKHTPNIYILTDLLISNPTIEEIKKLDDLPTIFIDDSFETCGIANALYKIIPEKYLLDPLCRISRNIPFAAELEDQIIVSKKRIKEFLKNI